jgi:diketogulonate reductase-like aldo/keto reductase
VLDQVELHPGFPQAPLRSFLTGEGIATEAWSPLGQGEILGDGVITRIAAEHGRTPAQVVLRWHIELGNIVIPKSVTPERIEENIAVFDFELGADEIDAITAIGSDRRQGPDPEQFDLGARSQ